MPIAILTFAVYSTAMSALFLVVAFYEPRYGPMICTDCKLTIANATILTTFFAKTIELTFVTVIVAFLGQALARRAYDKRIENGITHWESVRYAGVTVLGIIALLATILAMLYVTAAQALVGPQLKSNESGNRSMQGSFPW
jgi:hypothetical protein